MPITPNNPADFTPSLGNYKELKPFRFWCQKVLPLVYDDSLSYYELLCKVVEYLNNTMEDVDTLHTDVENLHTAYEDLQDYVNDYFSTLDVQEEINNKLDDMAESGELSALIVPLLPEPIDDWLSEHITNPSNPPLDTSLLLANAAAPAKTVGDKLKTVTKNAIITANNYSTIVTDLNDVTDNVNYSMLGVSSLIENYPSKYFEHSPTLFTSIVRNNGQNMAGDIQIMQDGLGNKAIRLYSNSWSAWTYFTDSDNEKGNVIKADNYATLLPDLDTVTDNVVYSLVGVSSSISNYPTGFSSTPAMFISAVRSKGVHTVGDIQYIISTNTKQSAMRVYTGSGWGDWYRQDNSEFPKCNVVKSDNYATVLPDLNTVTENAIYSLVGVSSSISNYPTGFSSTPAMFASIVRTKGTHTVGDIQYILSTNTKQSAMRVYTGSSWGDWYRQDNSEFPKCNVVKSDNYATVLPDLDNVTENVIYSLVGLGSLVAHYPGVGFSSAPTLFISIVRTKGSHTVGDMQYMLSTRTNYYAMRIYTGSGWGVWYTIKDETLIAYTTGNNDFASVLKSTQSNANIKNVELHVVAGVYDLTTELATYFSTASALPITECVVSKNTTIIFEQGAVVKCNYTGSNNFIKEQFSIITNRTGSLKLVNANFECKNIRYCVHSEHAPDTNSYVNEYVNCIMDIDNSANSVFTSGQALGCGLGDKGYFIVDGGIYKGTPYVDTDNAKLNIRIHNRGFGNIAKSHVEIRNCYCEFGIGAVSNGETEEQTEFIVTNCSMAHDVIESFSSGATIQNMEVIKWNNVIRT